MKKTMIALAVAASTVFSASIPCGVIGEEIPAVEKTVKAEAARETEPVQKESVQEKASKEIWKRQSDLKLDIRNERQLMEESGLSLDEWDEQISRMKEEGLSNPLDEETLLKADPDAEVKKEDGSIYFIGKNKALMEVRDVMDAYKAVYSLVGMLGGSEDTDLRLWSRFDIKDRKSYSFQQVSRNEEVMGSTIKIVTDSRGRISAVFSSLDPEMSQQETLVSRQEAENTVLSYLKEAGAEEECFPELTERVIYQPVTMEMALNLDVEEDPVPSLVVWVVYTTNENAGGENQDGEYPYLAHYIKLDGTYIKSLPVKAPGSEEALNGYRKQDVFEGMTKDEWTGEIVNYAGESRTVTIPVMRSEKDGKWYLGDVDRRIAVADFAEAAYGENHNLEVISCPSNTEWENEDLYMYYNYIRSWDFYKDLGWDGPEGDHTDVIILKNLCTSSGASYENACSVGKVENYSMFGYTGTNMEGAPLGLVQGLDVMAHEYTHTFTAKVMNCNLYENDYGAINEAMSDILGNLIEHMYEDSEDPKWVLGENTGTPVRSMTDPHSFQQPEYVWDCFYGPHTDTPVEMNDRGGVHFNSSLLNRIAALLCTEHDMSNEEAVNFWLMVCAGLTPKTDYVRMQSLLDWAIVESGNKAFKDVLDQLIEEERLSETELPKQIQADQKLVKLALPDTEVFNDENWALMTIQLDMSAVGTLADLVTGSIRSMFEADDSTDTGAVLENLIEHLRINGAKLELDETASEEEQENALVAMVQQALSGLLIQSASWRETDSGEIVTVMQDNPTLYVLMNATEAGTKINGIAVLWNGKWHDLGNKAEEVMAFFPENLDEMSEEEAAEATARGILDLVSGIFEKSGDPEAEQKGLMDYANDAAEAAKMAWEFIDHYILSEKPDGKTMIPAEAQYLPTEGLEDIRFIDPDSFLKTP